MNSINSVNSLLSGQQVGAMQIKLAAKVKEITQAESQAVLKLLEAASENLSKIADDGNERLDLLA